MTHPLTVIMILALTAPIARAAAAEPPLIPKPIECRMLYGTFTLSSKTTIVYPPELQDIAELGGEQLGLEASIASDKQRDTTIDLSLDPTLPSEAYRLEIEPTRITITGGSAAGAYYALQTLRQIVGPRAVDGSLSIPCLAIRDQPRFRWRGLMLDCSRTFQSLDYIRKTIDRLSFYKMNVLHLHLTDDQGWRMEIRKHPELTEKGSRFSAKYSEPAANQGFYTQEQLKELVAYAKLRGVTLVPEIEMPGHSHAALVCRPDLCCTGVVPDDIFPFYKGPHITEDIFCAGNDDAFAFLCEALDEVIEVFPSKYIHVGGDEAPKTYWKNCPKCQARIEAEGLRGEDDLQAYFMRRIERHLAAKGRRLLGWDEILGGGLPPNAAVMSWRGVDGGITAAKAGHDVVMSPTTHCYFDYPYTAIDSKRAYGFDPVAGLTAEQHKFVLGLQACFWSHIDRRPSLVDRQIFPRLLSLAERGWSQGTITDWPDFASRLQAHFDWLHHLGIEYYAADPTQSALRGQK